MADTETLADLLRDRYGPDLPAPKHGVLWSALMVCHDCPHRMIDHDELAMRCTVCRCNQSSRGLSSHADERLRALGLAMRDAWPTPAAPQHVHPDDEFVARAQAYRTEHEATHEDEMCGGPCIVLGLTAQEADRG